MNDTKPMPISPRRREEAYAAPTWGLSPAGDVVAEVFLPASRSDCGLHMRYGLDDAQQAVCIAAFPEGSSALPAVDVLRRFPASYRAISSALEDAAAYWRIRRPLRLATGVDTRGRRMRPTRYYADQPFQPNLYRGTIWRIDPYTQKRTVLQRVYN